MTRSPLPEAAAEVAALRRRIAESAPRRGWRPPDDAAVRFATLPLSARTLAGLAGGGFETLKPIQRAAIPHALADRDVLGAARTGSGKTLAFLVPAVEALYRERWAREDGLGALVVSPTRELALQIFGVLRVVGARHDFSAGLITGGRTRDWAAEQARVVRASLLVATPGRALQHLEETPGLDAGRLQALVDEADRVVDLGFAPQLDAIATYLPAAGARRTWLFSATLAGVGGGGARLARLRARSRTRRPSSSSWRATTGRRSCAPARPRRRRRRPPRDAGRARAAPRRLRPRGQARPPLRVRPRARREQDARVREHVRAGAVPPRGARGAAGAPLAALHGKQSQAKRVAVFRAFAARSGGAVLVATDVAARGLDVPDVDWVVQLDAPEDADAYVHRVGRAARNGRRATRCSSSRRTARRVDAALAAAGLRVDVVRADPGARVRSRARRRARRVAARGARGRRPVLPRLRPRRGLHAGADAAALPLAAYARSLGLPTAPRVALRGRRPPPRTRASARTSPRTRTASSRASRRRLPPRRRARPRRRPVPAPPKTTARSCARGRRLGRRAAALARAAAAPPPPRARAGRAARRRGHVDGRRAADAARRRRARGRARRDGRRRRPPADRPRPRARERRIRRARARTAPPHRRGGPGGRAEPAPGEEAAPPVMC